MSASRAQSLVVAWQKGSVQHVHGWDIGARFVKRTPSGMRRASAETEGAAGWMVAPEMQHGTHSLVLHPGMCRGHWSGISVPLMIRGGDWLALFGLADSTWISVLRAHPPIANPNRICTRCRRLQPERAKYCSNVVILGHMVVSGAIQQQWTFKQVPFELVRVILAGKRSLKSQETLSQYYYTY